MYYPSNQKNPRRLYRFPGGLHLPENKIQSTGNPIRKARLPRRLILPLQQHIGTPAKLLVAVGERVLKGQTIALQQGRISAPLHASSSGTVIDVSEQPVAHPSALPAPCITIETDGKDEWAELPAPMSNYNERDPTEIVNRIREAGIVGLGGASFPTSVKLDPGAGQPVTTLIINGAECEPYITCDDMLMREQSPRIVAGVAILKWLSGARECLIGIEDNKPQAIAAMQQALEAQKIDGCEVVTIPTRYPSGGERQLIRVLTGKEVPSGQIPARIGILCNNVGTAAAVADAVLEGKPLISRTVTLTGEGTTDPCNMEVLIGTQVSELIEQAGGYTDRAARLIMGGPMMGFTLEHDRVPVVKASNCLLVASTAEAPDPGAATACIRCGQCADACPVSLLPQQMYWYARAKDLEKTQEYNLFDCIECGCCSHVCPAHIPLVQYFRFAKNESWDQELERKKAELARQRHEARAARIARMEAEKKARMQKKRAALAKNPPPKKGAKAADPKKAAIEAAMKRAAEKKAKLAAEGVQPKNTANLNAAQQRQIEKANVRRGGPAGEESQSGTSGEDS